MKRKRGRLKHFSVINQSGASTFGRCTRHLRAISFSEDCDLKLSWVSLVPTWWPRQITQPWKMSRTARRLKSSSQLKVFPLGRQTTERETKTMLLLFRSAEVDDGQTALQSNWQKRKHTARSQSNGRHGNTFWQDDAWRIAPKHLQLAKPKCRAKCHH